MTQNYSLIESKLRRYFHLGHEYSLYVPTSSRKKFWKNYPQNFDDLVGVRIIGKIVRKNKPEEINSIIPIILKVKKEGKLLDDKHLIFVLAVCAKFNLEQCLKMVIDAYRAVSFVCTDGLKLLMFVKFCQEANIILLNEGYIPKTPTGVGNGFRKAIKKWYLNKDPLLTTELITKDKHYDGWTHKDVMRLIHINSDDPTRQIFIIYTLYDMRRVEALFGSQVRDIQNKNDYDNVEHLQLHFVYNYLKKVESMKTMSENEFVNDIELQRWGHSVKVIPPHMFKKPSILASLIIHMPPRDVLENTFFFVKRRLFTTNLLYEGLTEYTLRFNNAKIMREDQIHPIDAYLEYVKYSRTFKRIIKGQNELVKRKEILKFNETHKIQHYIETPERKRHNNYSSSLTINTQVEEKCKTQFNPDENTTKILPKIVNKRSFKKKRKKKPKRRQAVKQLEQLLDKFSVTKENEFTDTTNLQSTSNINIQQNYPQPMSGVVEDQVQSDVNTEFSQSESKSTFMRSAPKLMDKLLQFLSKDLFKKSLKILKPTDKRILIAYDSRKEIMRLMCRFTPLLKVHEAITLVTLSLIFPEKSENKPTVLSLNEDSDVDKVEYGDISSFKELENILFKESSDEWDVNYKRKKISTLNVLSVLTWARTKNEMFDVVVFLGTHKMDFRRIKLYMNNYKKVTGKPIKIIICCLNGKHAEQMNLGQTNMLFISGFDKYVGKIIHSFINHEF